VRLILLFCQKSSFHARCHLAAKSEIMVPGEQKSETRRPRIFANSITLTPGTGPLRTRGKGVFVTGFCSMQPSRPKTLAAETWASGCVGSRACDSAWGNDANEEASFFGFTSEAATASSSATEELLHEHGTIFLPGRVHYTVVWLMVTAFCGVANA